MQHGGGGGFAIGSGYTDGIDIRMIMIKSL